MSKACNINMTEKNGHFVVGSKMGAWIEAVYRELAQERHVTIYE
jgi:hypothetical protein